MMTKMGLGLIPQSYSDVLLLLMVMNATKQLIGFAKVFS